MLYNRLYKKFYVLFYIYRCNDYIMEKLTETINALKISKSAKEKLVQLAETEHLQIQQVCRILLYRALEKYDINNKDDIRNFLRF